MGRLTRAVSAIDDALNYTAAIAYGLRRWAACLRRERVETEPEIVG